MGKRSEFSNYGTLGHRWHVMAPGGEKTPQGEITEHVGTGSSGGKCSGTSPAAAYVSGMLALLRSEPRYESCARDQFLDSIMRDHCERAPGVEPLEYGSGQIVYTKK